jgi:hypothetical protein
MREPLESENYEEQIILMNTLLERVTKDVIEMKIIINYLDNQLQKSHQKRVTFTTL